MVALRMPLLLLLSLSICVPWWIILESLSQDWWSRSRCYDLLAGSSRGCILQSYNASGIRTCLSLQRLTIYGGAEAQQVFLSVAQSLDQQHMTYSDHELPGRLYDGTMLRIGMGIVAYQNNTELEALEVDPAILDDLYESGAVDQALLNHYYNYDPAASAIFYVASNNRRLPLNYKPEGKYFWFYEDELNSTSTQAQVVLNYVCPELLDPVLKQTQAYCCAGYTAPSILQKVLLVAGSCAFLVHMCSSALRGNLADARDKHPRPAAETQRFLAALATISATVIICFVADRTALLDKTSKAVDLISFVWLTSIALLAGLATFICRQTELDLGDERKDSTSATLRFLSRQQTEEWKGWMQIVILLYHYFGMSKVLWVYQIVRLLVSSYLFMTGFGHATYFITTNDFSFRRVAGVLLRTNLLNVILACVLETRYDLYYFPALTSLWFLIIWITIPRTADSGIDMRLYFRRIVMSAIAVRLALESGILLESFMGSLDSLRLGLPRLDGREFLFRFGLDANIPYVGMAAGILFARLKANDSLPPISPRWSPVSWSQLKSKLVVLVSLLVMPAYALFCHAFSDKIHYNKWHPYVSLFPVLAFVILRNSTCSLRASHSRLFAWFGRCSLETFVLQYHIWLAADSHGQLRLGLFKNRAESAQTKYLLNVLETIIIFIAFISISSTASKALSILTKVLVDLKAGVLLLFVGLWAVNLAGVIFPVLSHHNYYD